MINHRVFVGNALFALCLMIGIITFPNYVKAVPGQGTLYGTNPNDLIIVDPNTGVGNVVGPSGAFGGFPGFAIDQVTGLSFAGCGGGCDSIFNFNLDNGAATFLGSMNGGIVAAGLDFRADGILFAALNMVDDGGSGGDHLGIINTLTGESTAIGPFGVCDPSCDIDGIEAIAFDSQGILWGSLRTSPRGSGTPGLYRIDTDTGEATFVAPIVDSNGVPVTRGGVVSLQFGCDGTLYGGTAPEIDVSNGGFLVTINPDTGIFSFVGNASATDGRALGGLSFDLPCPSPIPTLSEWGLIAMAGVLGIIGLLAIRRRKVTV